MMTRRQGIKTAAVAAVGVAFVPRIIAQVLTDFAIKALEAGMYPFHVPLLPYSRDALAQDSSLRALLCATRIRIKTHVRAAARERHER